MTTKEVCNCGRPDLHYKFEFGKCPVPNQESTSSWEERFDEIYHVDIVGDYSQQLIPNSKNKFPIKLFIKQELESERQKAKEETLAMVLKEIEEEKVPIPAEDEELTGEARLALLELIQCLNEALDTLKEKLQGRENMVNWDAEISLLEERIKNQAKQ